MVPVRARERERERSEASTQPQILNPEFRTYAMYCRQATWREMHPTISIIILFPYAFNSIQLPTTKKQKKHKKKKLESRVHPGAPIFVVLKLLRSTSRVLSGTADSIRSIRNERPRSRGDSRRPHRYTWLWRRRFHLLRRVLAYGRTIKEFRRGRRPTPAAIGRVVRVEFVYRGGTTVCNQALKGGFVAC